VKFSRNTGIVKNLRKNVFSKFQQNYAKNTKNAKISKQNAILHAKTQSHFIKSLIITMEVSYHETVFIKFVYAH